MRQKRFHVQFVRQPRRGRYRHCSKESEIHSSSTKAYRRGWFYYCATFSLSLKVRFENGLARAGDRKILEYAATHDFILVLTDSDFERLLRQVPGATIVILPSCDYPTDVAAGVLRRNAFRIAELPDAQDPLIMLD